MPKGDAIVIRIRDRRTGQAERPELGGVVRARVDVEEVGGKTGANTVSGDAEVIMFDLADFVARGGVEERQVGRRAIARRVDEEESGRDVVRESERKAVVCRRCRLVSLRVLASQPGIRKIARRH